MQTTSGMKTLALVVALGGCTPSSSGDSSDDTDTPATSAGSSVTSEGSSATAAASSGGADGSSSGAAGEGTVTLAFSVSNGVRLGPTLVDPLVGSVYGDVYLTSDVTLTGPADGSTPVTSVGLDGVDLTTDEVSAATWTSEPLPPGSYTFLGMFDVDGNFDTTDESPDPGDPVTLPSQAFEIVAGEDTAFTVVFELVYG